MISRRGGYYRFKPSRAFKRYVGGFCLTPYRSSYADGANLSSFSIRDAHRGKGYARLMIRDAIRLATKLGYRRIVLAVFCDNLPAVRTYRGAGFRFYGSIDAGSIRDMRLNLGERN
jgi:RimJ/RimL family protein N-acetyltransferase